MMVMKRIQCRMQSHVEYRFASIWLGGRETLIETGLQFLDALCPISTILECSNEKDL